MRALVTKTFGSALALFALAIPYAQGQSEHDTSKLAKQSVVVVVSPAATPGIPESFKGIIPVPSDLEFRLGSVKIDSDAIGPTFFAKITSTGIEVSANLQPPEIDYVRQIEFTEKAPVEPQTFKKGSLGTKTLPAKKLKTEVRKLSIYVATKHALVASPLTLHYYVFDGGGEASRLNLGLQEVPDNVLRIGVLNDSPFKAAISAARAIITDSNGAPVTDGLSVSYNKAVLEPAAQSVPAGNVVIPHSAEEMKVVEPGLVIPSHGYRVLTVDLGKAHLNPGLYGGFLQLDSDHPNETTNYAFKLDVRSHPFKALVAILIGLLVGYTLFWLNGVRQAYTQQLGGIAMSLRALEKDGLNQHILDLFDWHYERLKDRVDPDETDPNQGLLERVKGSLSWTRTDPALDSSLSADLSKFRSVISSTSILLALESRAIALLPADSSELAAIKEAIAGAWGSVAKFDVTSVSTAIQGIESALFVPSTPTEPSSAGSSKSVPASDGVKPPEALSLVSNASDNSAKVCTSPEICKATNPKEPPNLKVQVASAASVIRRKIICDPNDLRGSIRNIQVLRAFVASFAMILLIFTGLNLLYVGVQGFGHSIYDYLKAVAWGFSAGAAGRGLSTTIASWASNLLP